MSFSINEFLGWALAIVFLGVVLGGIIYFDLIKIGNFFPDFGDADEDKIIADAESVEDVVEEEGDYEGTVNLPGGEEGSLQEGETCCCLYENMKNTGECKGAELELNQYCKDKLEDGWVNVNDDYCKNEK